MCERHGKRVQLRLQRVRDKALGPHGEGAEKGDIAPFAENDMGNPDPVLLSEKRPVFVAEEPAAAGEAELVLGQVLCVEPLKSWPQRH